MSLETPTDTPTGTVCLAGSSLAFSWLPLEEALARVAALGFRFVDLAAVPGWAHVEPAALAASPRERARVVAAARASGVEIVALNGALGHTEDDVSRDAHALAETALAAGASIVTIQPPDSGTPLVDAVARLGPVRAVAEESGIAFSLEIHRDRVTEIPTDAARLAEESGLGLTLDPSHIYAGPAHGEGVELVLPYVDHVHVRDARAEPADLQVTIGTGDVPFAELFAELVRRAYGGIVSIEYVGRSASATVDADADAAARYVVSTWPAALAGEAAFGTS